MSAIITETHSTFTTRHDIETPFVIAGRNYATMQPNDERWEVRYFVTEQECHVAMSGGIVTDGPEDVHVYGVKLTKKNRPLTNVSHLLPWIHSRKQLCAEADGALW